MSIEVKVPQLPESVADATLIAWRKQPGEAVSRDENLVDLETDKVVLEVPAPAGGVIKELKVANGATVTSGQVLAILEEGAVAAATAAPAQSKAAAPAAASSTTIAEKSGPAARRALEETKVDAAQVAATGKDGRVTKGDVLQHAAKASAVPAAKPAAAALAPAGAR